MSDISSHLGLSGNGSLVTVLPNGMRQIVDTEGLETFADFKRKIELMYGLPYELQNIKITNGYHSVADWELVKTFKGGQNTEVFVRTDQEWTTFVSACLRDAPMTVLDFLETTETDDIFEKRLYVALFIAASTCDITLVRKLLGLRPNISKRTASGRNILHLAVATGDIDLTEAVLYYDCSDLIQAGDSRGETPLDLATKADNVELVEVLMSRIYQGNMAGKKPDEMFRKGRKISRASASNSLRITGTAESKSPNSSRFVSHSTPSSPQLRRKSQDPSTLGHGKTDDILVKKFDYSTRQGPTSGEIVNLPNILHVPPNQSTRPISGRRSSLAPRLSSPVPSAQRSPKSGREVRKFSAPDTYDDVFQLHNGQRGMQQVVFLPPWRRSGRSHSSEETKEAQKEHLEVQSKMPDATEERHRSGARSHSVASISPEDVSRLQEEVRVKKPWNEWRRISWMGKKEKKDLFQDFQNQTGDQKKSFESWLIGKEVMREEFEQQLLEEEHMKQLEKERIEEERKMKCKSYNTWLAEKEVENEESKEEEKRKEKERKVTEEKLQLRKTEAERKYEKWMREKYEEELRKEEELQRLMQEKWKIKKQEGFRRKSVATISTTKKTLSRSTSVPISQ